MNAEDDTFNALKYRRTVDEYGTIYHCNLDGQLHREDGPAIIYKNGEEAWYRQGALHREDGPAATYIDGTQKWYKHGLRHREDGPAVMYSNGMHQWFENGMLTHEYSGRHV